MTDEYRVKVYLTDFDASRAAELKTILKIYHNSQGKQFFSDLLHQVHEGERQLVYETNSDQDAQRVAQTFLRYGTKIEIDGLKEEESEF